MFRGKEFSNRIELSQLVQELLNFGVLSFLQLLGVGGGWMWVGVVGGAPPHMCTCTHMDACTRTHTHAHARTCMCGKHGNFMQMVVPIGESLGSPYDVIHAYMCMQVHACACMCTWIGCTLSPPPPRSTHPPSLGGPGIIQNSIALELMEIFQFCLKI